jgi:hypothetical protein
MLKSFSSKIVLMILIGVSLISDSAAQGNISFARGRNSATLKGSIRKNGEIRYTVRGKAGQTITVSVRSGNNYVFAGIEAVGQGRTVTGKLPYDSSYIIELSNGGNATDYTMTVTIM